MVATNINTYIKTREKIERKKKKEEKVNYKEIITENQLLLGYIFIKEESLRIVL